MFSATVSICLMSYPALAVASSESYALYLKAYPSQGKSVVIKSSEKSVFRTTVTAPNGEVVLQQDFLYGEELDYTLTVLEDGDKRPKRIKTMIRRAVIINNGKEIPCLLHGRTFDLELQNEVYQVKLLGEPSLPPKDLADICKLANAKLAAISNRFPFPRTPVRVGESWELDKAMVKGFSTGLSCDISKSGGKARLVKVNTKDGHRWGQVDLDVRIVLKEIISSLELDNPVDYVIKVSLLIALDKPSTAGTLTEVDPIV